MGDTDPDPKPAKATPAAKPAAEPAEEDRFYAGAAAVIVVGVVLMVVAELIAALAFDPDRAKLSSTKTLLVRASVMSVSYEIVYGTILIGVALVAALVLARLVKSQTALASATLIALVGTSLWLGMITALNVYFDVTQYDALDTVIPNLLWHLAALVVLAFTGFWGFVTFGARSDQP